VARESRGFGPLAGRLPIIAAPMAGGPSTPALVAAVGDAGGLGFIAGGYLSPERLERQLTDVERRSRSPYGVNLFLPSPPAADVGAVEAYRRRLEPEAARAGVQLGAPRWDDDQLAAKLDVVCSHRPAAVSFTFGNPSARVCDRVRAVTGAVVVATVASADEAAAAVAVDALCVQGAEAGAHRGVWRDDPDSPQGGLSTPLLRLLADVREVSRLPLIGTGGLVDGAGVRAALDAGAVAAQLGTAFLCCPEAGTSATHRRALLDRRFTETVLTRAFSGRTARALANRFARQHSAAAPAAYPEIHHLTRPLRQAAAANGDADSLHLWAGTGWRSVTEEPAADIVTRLERERLAVAEDQGHGQGCP
jgi:nitronate monooxygenase